MSIVTFAQIKEVTGLAKVVDESRKITPFLTEAEEELKKMLGTTLYAEVEAALPGFTGEPDLETLFDDYIKRPLCWRTLQYAYPRLYAEPTANGVHLVGDTNYAAVDSRTLAQQIAVCRDFADQGYERMLKYLKDNTATFPSYDVNVGSEERVTKTYPGGVITRKSRWQYPYGLKQYHPYEGGRNQYGECCDE